MNRLGQTSQRARALRLSPAGGVVMQEEPDPKSLLPSQSRTGNNMIFYWSIWFIARNC